MLHSYLINVVFCIVLRAFHHPNILQQFFVRDKKKEKKRNLKKGIIAVYQNCPSFSLDRFNRNIHAISLFGLKFTVEFTD